MFQYRKPCLCKETNDSYSRAVIGILVFLTLLVFVVSILGVTAFNQFSANYNRSILPMNSNSSSMLGCDSAESVKDNLIKANPSCFKPAYQLVCDPEHYYAEAGDIRFVEDNFASDLPICFDMTYGADKWVVIRVKGGYTPRLQHYAGYGDYYGLMTLYDADHHIVFNDCNPNMYVGWLLDSYTDVSDQYRSPDCLCSCCWVWYNFTLDPYACDNWVCLDSSYQLGEEGPNPDKYYTFEFNTHWTGCAFDKMLAHIYCVPESYTPDKTSPV